MQPNPQSYRSILTSVPYLTSSLESYLSWPASSLTATAALILPIFLNSNVCLLSIKNATAKVQIALLISEQSSSSHTLFTNFFSKSPNDPIINILLSMDIETYTQLYTVRQATTKTEFAHPLPSRNLCPL